MDDEDYPLLSRLSWALKEGYAVWVCTLFSGRTVTIRMHRLVCPAVRGLVVDHVDGNRLNNTKENLRAVPPGHNTQNSRKKKKPKSGFLGVEFTGRTYRARITVRGKVIQLGSYETAEEAARVYDEAAKKYYGAQALTNERLKK